MKNTDFDKILGYYAQGKEWDRLETAAGKLEYLRTLQLIEQYLPEHSRILDLGGGPGRYTIALAQRNHWMNLADISPDLLEIATRKIVEYDVASQIESVAEINAVDLSKYEDDSFDAVLALGPFYHLQQETEREQCANEIHRVLRKEGFLFVAFVPKLSMLAGLINRASTRPEEVSASNFSFGRYAMISPSACGLSQMGYSSIVRLPSVRTCLSVKDSKVAAFPDRESESGLSVREAANIVS